ncbi:MAG: hypothetical protein M1836_006483 [Candelina mexicana]|nr:MAG: hypothetical protein M1836_006483 [Candelina mexicana]
MSSPPHPSEDTTASITQPCPQSINNQQEAKAFGHPDQMLVSDGLRAALTRLNVAQMSDGKGNNLAYSADSMRNNCSCSVNSEDDEPDHRPQGDEDEFGYGPRNNHSPNSQESDIDVSPSDFIGFHSENLGSAEEGLKHDLSYGEVGTRSSKSDGKVNDNGDGKRSGTFKLKTTHNSSHQPNGKMATVHFQHVYPNQRRQFADTLKSSRDERSSIWDEFLRDRGLYSRHQKKARDSQHIGYRATNVHHGDPAMAKDARLASLPPVGTESSIEVAEDEFDSEWVLI